jgi:hypothetical protein
MNVGIGTVAAKFLSWEYLFQIFGAVSLQCVALNGTLFEAKIPTTLQMQNLAQSETKRITVIPSRREAIVSETPRRKPVELYKHRPFIYKNKNTCNNYERSISVTHAV